MIAGRMRVFYVYFLCCKGDSDDSVYVKIGMSGNPLRRARSVLNSCGLPALNFIYTGIGCKAETQRMETALHAAFVLWRTRGEWYRFEAREKNTFLRIRKETMDAMNTFHYRINFQSVDINAVMEIKRRNKHVTTKRFAKRIRYYARKNLQPGGKNAKSASRMSLVTNSEASFPSP